MNHYIARQLDFRYNNVICIISEENPCVDHGELDRLIVAVAEAAEAIDIQPGNHTATPKWTILNAIFLATTVVSTIGT